MFAAAASEGTTQLSTAAAGRTANASRPAAAAPSAPRQLHVAWRGRHAVSVAWRNSTDNVRVAGYRVFRDGVQVAHRSGRTQTFRRLRCDRRYDVAVAAYDAAGHVSRRTALRVRTARCARAGVSSRPFSRLHPVWHQRLPAEPPLLPGSAAIVAFLRAHGGFANANLSLRGYTVADAVVRGRERRYDIACTAYACDLGRFGAIPIPAGARPSYGSDAHLSIYDPRTNREWDLWGASYDAARDRWTAKSGTARDLSRFSDSIGGRFGAVSVNWPALAGLVYPQELEDARRIDHPLAVALPSAVVSTRHVWPASKSDGYVEDSRAVPEGALIQLDPAVDCGALSIAWWEKVLCRTLQRYGAYVRDKGGAFQIYGEDARNRGRGWKLTGERYAFLSAGFPFNRLRVLKPRNQW